MYMDPVFSDILKRDVISKKGYLSDIKMMTCESSGLETERLNY